MNVFIFYSPQFVCEYPIRACTEEEALTKLRKRYFETWPNTQLTCIRKLTLEEYENEYLD